MLNDGELMNLQWLLGYVPVCYPTVFT